MRIVPIEELSDAHWADAHKAMYDPKLAEHMGSDPNLIRTPPSLEQFYMNVMDAVEAGKFKAWALLDDDDTYVGHTVLDKSSGEWESGTMLWNPQHWGSGLGVRATLYALRWAFETDGADWVIAFTNGVDPRVIRMHEKAGYQRFMHFWIFSRHTWETRWADKAGRLTWAQPQ